MCNSSSHDRRKVEIDRRKVEILIAAMKKSAIQTKTAEIRPRIARVSFIVRSSTNGDP